MLVCKHCGDEIRQSHDGGWRSKAPNNVLINPWIYDHCSAPPKRLHEPSMLVFGSREALETWLDADS